ncbi:uncharacterized protein LOC108195880 [Daucus carota subsp. sativus]|uniref:uncharacterized protein LOC108195880 n=1 Tax=Daucus carota subsp. sativus TaxID=79200 RepID=UPI0007EF9563|nr:PREDICTED: uncharacterized protein LOC108195880 [Daucus carota subsp. sativus]
MEEGMGSADRGSDVIKKKSSSGCLIIKKKVNGVSGFGGSSSKKSLESRSEKKRSRLVLTDSGSSDEVEPVRRRVREDIIYERRRSGIEDCRMLGFERKRGGIDVFEFDEYDGFDGKRMRMDYMDDRLKLVGRNEDYQGFEIGSSRNVGFDGRKGSISGGKSKGHNHSGKSRYEEEDDDDESHVPISIFREKRHEALNESIRVQGKNGVLKVMVNKKKQQGFPLKGSDNPRAEERMSSRSEAAVKKNKEIRPSSFSGSKRPENLDSLKTEKTYLNSRKPLPTLSSKVEDKDEDSDSGGSEKSLKQETREQVQKFKKAIESERKRTTTPTKFTNPPSGGKESKGKRGYGTEKQLLREKIRSMLLDRGWKIDYRPRRNRDYLDAVYINPAGTAYWSIIKAYDALQKQLEEEEDNVKPFDESPSFTPLPEEIISKLTRQTRKKIERELKKKKRDAVCSRNAKEVTMRESTNCTDSGGRLHEADSVSGNESSGNLYQVKAKKDTAERQSASNSHIIQGRKSRKIGRCTLLVRNSDKGLSEADGYVPYTGKRTILSWLVDSGIVQTSEKVQYMNGKKTRVMLEGWITKDGIHCGCCSKILTISKFEIHAGSKQRQPFLNIYLESGMSLLQCQIDAWNKQEESKREAFHSVDVNGDDPNDDTCGLCGDGGDLICCDGCPSTFHQTCLDIKMLPTGDWHCPNCTCKFCGLAGRSNAKADDRTDSSLLLCSLCEKKYHQSCRQDEFNIAVNSGDAANSFCGKNCQEIFSHLQKLLGVKHELESGFSWSLVHRMDPASERLHLGFSQRVECNSKLAVALSVMDECFLPIVDRRSGINLIHNVLYNRGSNFGRLNFNSFYTAILEKGDEIISAASIRIHGLQLAEMPFIGTRHIYRRQGMCRRLLSAIELALSTLKVEKLIIPAIAEHMNTWTEKFNFSPLKKSHNQEMRSMNMLVFPRTDMLQKSLIKRDIAEGSIINNSGLGMESAKENEDSLTLSVLGVSETNSSLKHDINTDHSTDLLPLSERSSKASTLLSSSKIPIVPLNDVTAKSGALVSFCEVKDEPAEEMTPTINSVSVDSLADTTTVNFKSTHPSNEHPSSFLAQKAELGQSVKDHTQSFVDGIIIHKEEAKETSGELIGVSLCEISKGKTEEDHVIVFQNSVSVHDSVSRGTNESTLVESNMSTHTAVDLDNSCEVHMDKTSANLPKDSVEQLCSQDNVEDNALPENSLINIEEDPTAIQNSVHARDCEGRLINSNTSNHTAVDLTDTCEVHVINTSPRDAAKHAGKDIVGNETLRETFDSNIEEDATAIQKNSVSVYDSVSLGACGNTDTDFDMTNQTAYDLDDSCEVDANDTSFNALMDSGEQLPSTDFVKDGTLPETFGASIEEDATPIQNSFSVHDSASLGGCESTHIDSEKTNLTAVDLNHNCEVHLNETFVNSPKDSAEQLSSKDIVEEDTSCETFSGIIKEDATAPQNSVSVNVFVSLGPCEGMPVDLDKINPTAVDLDNSCEVKANDSCVNSQKDSAEQLSLKDLVQNDTSSEAFSATIKEDATAYKNSLSVHNSVSLGARESTQIDSDITNITAVDLDNSYVANVNDTSVNCPKDAVEQLSAKENVEDDSLCETSAGNLEKDPAVQNYVSVQIPVSHDTCGSTPVDFDMSKHPAEYLDNTCEVDLNDTCVNSPKDCVEQSAIENTVKEDVTAPRIITHKNGGNVVDDIHEVEQEAAYAEPLMDPFHRKFQMKNTAQAISEDPSELSSATDVVGDEKKGDLKNYIMGDAQEGDVKISSIKPIVESGCDTSVANSTCQALNENETGFTSDERTKDVKSVSSPLDDMKSNLHVMATEVSPNSFDQGSK